MSKAILVAGMHRSGTSATTGALRMCGISLGSDFVPAADDNRLGYWENAKAVAIHEQLLERLQRSWDDVRSLPHDWLESGAALDAARQIETLVREEFAGEPLWAVKDPRICRFLPLWKEVLGRMGIPIVVLIVARRPSEVAASIQKRNDWLPALGELLWLRHVFEAERDSRELQRCVVTYDDMIADPRGTMFRALGRLGITPSAESFGDAIERFISGDERHHSHESDEELSADIAGKAFRLLSSIARDNEGWGAFSLLGDIFEARHAEDSRYVDALADSAWKLRRRNNESDEAIAEVRSSLNAQIAWSEQAVHREQELQAALAHAREDFNAQVQWSNEAIERQRRLEQELQMAEFAHRSSEDELASVRNELASTRKELASVREELASTLSSFSWKITVPIRLVERLVSRKIG